MNAETIERILKCTYATNISKKQTIQSLWSGYGEIYRCHLVGGNYTSVVVKHVNLVAVNDHPKGWNTDVSHQRKVKSYEVERNWYEGLSNQIQTDCQIPKLIDSWDDHGQVFMIMEDLNQLGFPMRKSQVNLLEIKACLTWLANFHGQYMGVAPTGLWQFGTYWHLSTRRDEWDEMQNIELKNVAYDIDHHLNQCQFKTIVHGDAKLANFCFSNEGAKVAAVDFQYIGGGCGMKDVAYLISSCFDEMDCETHENELINHYFNQLNSSLYKMGKGAIFQEVEKEWSELYKYAWADFYRFLDGWSPGHYKMHKYSERLTREVLADLNQQKY